MAAAILSRISRKRKKEPVVSVWSSDSETSSTATTSTVDIAAMASADSAAGFSHCGSSTCSEQSSNPSMSGEKSFPALQQNPHKMSSTGHDDAGGFELVSWDTAGARIELPTPQANQLTDHIDPMDISVSALGHRTRTLLSLHLNPPQITGNDWRGLADYMDFSYLEIENFALRPDPTGEVLKHWECKATSTIGMLAKLLTDLEREDVLMALEKCINLDVERWIKKHTSGFARVDGQPVQDPEVSGTSYFNRPLCPDLRGITLEDHPDGPIQTFDAFICHNTETDYPFVQELLQKMEKPPYNLRFCTEWRDLVPGGSYAEVTAELIENRCRRMLVVLTPEFLQSEKCDFHIKFALSLSPGARHKRMVLVMLKPCEPPNILRFITVCDYTREALRPYFWPRLYASLNLS